MKNWDLHESVETTEDFKVPPHTEQPGSNKRVLEMTNRFLKEEDADWQNKQFQKSKDYLSLLAANSHPVSSGSKKKQRIDRPRNFSMDMTSNSEVWEKGAQDHNPSLANEYDLRQSPVSFPEAQDVIGDGNFLATMGQESFAQMPQATEETQNTFKNAAQNYDSNFLPISGNVLSPIVKKAAKASANRRKRGTKRKRGGRRSRKKRTKRRKRKSRRKRTKRRKGGVKGTPSTGKKRPKRGRQLPATSSRLNRLSRPDFNRRLTFREIPRPRTFAMTAPDQVSPHTMQIGRLDRGLALRRRERRNIARSGTHAGRGLNARMDELKEGDAEEVIVVDTPSEPSNDKENTPPGPPGPGGGTGIPVNGGRRRRKTKRRRHSRKKRTRRR